MYNLLQRIKKETNKPIWLWTGYRINEIPYMMTILISTFVDVLIDGQFEMDKKDLKLIH